jgi:prolyl-tRNA synthetase
MMLDKKALQCGTSHNLGQNFARAFDIKYVDVNNNLQFCWTTSWGMSTRMVGAVVMAHGDDKGLRLPPKLAPIQVVIVPIYKNDAEQSLVMETVARLKQELVGAGVRVHVDARDAVSPGFKYNDWEMRGVPVRMEIGPKDVEKHNAVLARRDMGKEGKQVVSQEGIAQRVKDLLADVQANMLKQATDFRDANIHDVTGYDQLRQVVEAGGWARGWWAGSGDDEGHIKDETGATIRCFPFEQPTDQGKCFMTGKDGGQIALFGRAY